MKKLILFSAFLFISTMVSAQEFVKASDVTVENVAQHLQSKKFKIVEKTATFLKIQNADGNSLYLDFDKNQKYIMFNISNGFTDAATDEKKQVLIDNISKLSMIKGVSFAKSNSVQFEYYFWITGGFSWTTLDDAIEEFYLYEGDALALDTEKLIK